MPTRVYPPRTSAGSGVTFQEEGVDVVVDSTVFNVVGESATVTDVGGVPTLEVSDGSGAGTILQGSFSRKRPRWWTGSPTGGLTGIGMPNPTVVASGGSAAKSSAATGYYDQWGSQTLRVTGVVGSWAGHQQNTRYFWRGNLPYCGGFLAVFEFAVSTAPDTFRIFCGLSNSVAAFTTGNNPSTLLDMVGVGCDGTDSNLQVMHNDSGGTATKIDLGGSYLMQGVTKLAILAAFYCDPNSSEIDYYVSSTTNAGVKAETLGTLSSNLPTDSQLLAPGIQMASVSVATSTDAYVINRAYFETPGY
jgi:hypothetical protein